jgi:hypothetical protein
MHSVGAARTARLVKHARLEHFDQVGAVAVAGVAPQVQVIVFMVVQSPQKVLRMRLMALKNVWSRPCVRSVGLIRLVMHLMNVCYPSGRAAILDVRRGRGGHHIASMRFRFLLRWHPAQIDSFIVVHIAVTRALYPRRLLMNGC